MNIDNSNKFLRSIDTNPLPIVIIKLRTKYIIPKNAGINAKYKKGIISDNLKKQQKIIKSHQCIILHCLLPSIQMS